MNPPRTDWKLSFNNEPVAPATDLTILPGKPNVLVIESAEEAVETTAVLVRTHPNGTRYMEDVHLLPATTHAFDLGPMTAPPGYEFEAGVVYTLGYRIELILTSRETRRVVFRCDWGQAPSAERKSWRIYPGKPAPPISAGALRFVSGAERRIVFNPKGAVEATLDLRLDPAVLYDPHALSAMIRLNPGALVETLSARLRVVGTDGSIRADVAITVKRGDKWQSVKLPATDWPDGSYVIALHPELDGQLWDEGPEIVYHKQTQDPDTIPVSPYAPFTLQRDTTRDPIATSDFAAFLQAAKTALPTGWTFTDHDSGVALVTEAQQCPDPVALPLKGVGLYAVFVTPAANGCTIQVESDGLIRPMAGPLATSENNGATASEFGPEVFVAIADLSKGGIRLFGLDQPADAITGLRGLRLEPVTAESAKTFSSLTRDMALPISGVNDWGCYFHGRDGFIPPRMQPDQFDTIVGAQAEVGISRIDWSIGRSSVQYNSKIPGIPITRIGPKGVDPLDEIIRSCRKFGSSPRGWYALMYYGKKKNVPERNAIFERYPEFRRWKKNAKGPDEGETAGQLMSYYFPEIRADKVQPLIEAAERGADALLLCSIRLAPLMDYHPEMVAAYRDAFGIDPNAITDSTSPEFRHWIKWRADFFTCVLRELREGLKPVEEARSQQIQIGMRMPSSGLDYNLTEGMDVEQWLDEGLVDYLQIAGLESLAGPDCNSHDIRPYVELGKRYGIPVFGAIGATWCRTAEGMTTALRRVHGLHAAGVDGIEIYESETIARCSRHRWMTPLFGQPDILQDFIATSNLEACYPTGASTCLYGYDNHSRWWVDGQWAWFLDGSGEHCL